MKSQLDKIKYLFEYTFKGSGRSTETEKPLTSKFPTYDEYKEDVMIDEDNEELPAEPEAAPAPAPEAPAPAPEAPVTTPAPADAQGMPSPAPAPAPEAPQAGLPAQDGMPADAQDGLPQPAPAPEEDPILSKIESTLSMQDDKIEQLMNSINSLNQAINPQAVPQTPEEKIMAKLDNLSKEVESIKNPSTADKLEKVSKHSSPFNIKLSDYYKDEEEEQPEKEYTIKPSDVDNYDVNKIKQSFGNQ